MPHHLERCPVCTSEGPLPQYRHVDARSAAWSVFRCGECGLGFVDPMPSWAELQPYYRTDYYAYDDAAAGEGSDERELRAAATSGELRHAPIKAGTRLLDVGCGAGSFIRLASRLGAIAEGIEPSELGVAAARRAGLCVFHGTAEEYAAHHGERRFDVITANHVLEHVHDPVRTLGVMKNLLAHGGCIVIAVPNARCYVARSLKGHWHSADLPRHVMQFGKTSLEEAGRRAGLRLDVLKTYSYPKAVASSLRAWLRRRWFIPVRLSGKMTLLEKAAGMFARHMDRRTTGEALIAQFRPVTTADVVDRTPPGPWRRRHQAAIRNPVAPTVEPSKASV